MVADLGFLFVGAYAIADIALAMKREYDRMKQQIEEDEAFEGLFNK